MDGTPPTCALSLVIPAYNEEAGIARAIAEADEALAGLGRTYELLIVDDGSTDGTARKASETAARRPNVRVLRHDINRGYGAALRTGFETARGRLIAFTDADCQFHLEDLGLLLPLTEVHPIVVGFRVGRQDPWLRRFYSRGYNLLARALLGTGVVDVDCALKVFRRETLFRLMPESGGFFVNTEVLTRARQQNLTVAQVGVRHRPRLQGESKVGLRDIPRTLDALLPFWWSRTLFAGQADARPAPRQAFALLAVLALMACALFLGRLHQPLLEPEEARYAEVPRQMLAEGRLLTPVLHGEDYLQKPPLLYWLVMAAYRVFGVHDWAARLVPACAGVATVLVTALWGWRALGFWTGVVGGSVVCLSARFLYQAGMLSMDSLLCLCVIGSLACGHLALAEPRHRLRWGLLSAVACGLGVLTKGPVALALVGPPLLALTFLDRRSPAPSLRGVAGYLAVTSAVALPWFAAVAWQSPGAAGEFVWMHNVRRFLIPLDHEKPAWFYLPALLTGALPWTLLLVPLAPYLLRRSARAAGRRPAALGLLVLALGWCMLFFSLSGCKRPAYILPAFPLLALVLGTFVTHGLPRRWLDACAAPATGLTARLSHRLAHRLVLAALAVGAAVCGAAAASGLWSWGHAGGATLFLAAGALLPRQPRPTGPAWRPWAWCGATVFALLLAGTHALLPAYHQRFALRRQVNEQLEFAREADLPVACYPKRWDSISFYLGRDDVEVWAPDKTRPSADLRPRGPTLVFVKREGALAELLRSVPEGWVFEPRGEPGPNVAVGLLRPR